MTKREQVHVDEEMMRGIMMKEVPVYDNNVSSGAEETPVPEKDSTPTPISVSAPDTGGSQSLPRTKGRKPLGKREKKENESGESYAVKFLMNDRNKNRVSANISRELFERIRKFLPVIAPDITLTSYLNNIIFEHMETHWDEICELYNSETEKPL